VFLFSFLGFWGALSGPPKSQKKGGLEIKKQGGSKLRGKAPGNYKTNNKREGASFLLFFLGGGLQGPTSQNTKKTP